MITIQCRQCGEKFPVKDEFGGQVVKCKYCDAENTVPDADTYYKYAKAIELIEHRSDKKQIQAIEIFSELEGEIGIAIVAKKILQQSKKVQVAAIKMLLHKDEPGREVLKEYLKHKSNIDILRKVIPDSSEDLAEFLADEMKKKFFDEKQIVQILPFITDIHDEKIFEVLEDIDEQFPNLTMLVKQIRVKLMNIFEDLPEGKKGGCGFFMLMIFVCTIVSWSIASCTSTEEIAENNTEMSENVDKETPVSEPVKTVEKVDQPSENAERTTKPTKKTKRKGSVEDSVFSAINTAMNLANRGRYKAAREKLENLKNDLESQKENKTIAKLIAEVTEAQTKVDKLEKENGSGANLTPESEEVYYWKNYTQAQLLFDTEKFDECIKLCDEMLEKLEVIYEGFDTYSPMFKELKELAVQKK